MRIAVLGSNGFIGRHCVDHFRARGHEVSSADVTPSDEPGYVELRREGTDFGPLFDRGPHDACINASGSGNVQYSLEEPFVDYELNTINVHRILRAVRSHDPECRLINLSSAAVYGQPVSLPVREDAPAAPISPYGFHKRQSELLMEEYARCFGARTCSLRVFSAYGPGLRKQLFWDLHQKANAGRVVELFGTGKETRDFVYVRDLCRAIEVVIDAAPFAGESINVATGAMLEIRDAARAFLEVHSPGYELRFSGEDKKGDPSRWQADISKLRAMGFEPEYEFERGIAEYVRWLREHD